MEEYYNMVFDQENIVEIKGNIFTGCSFNGLNLNSADFSYVMLEECNFINCSLVLVKFTGAKLRQVNFISSRLLGISFVDCDKLIVEINFKECVIMECNLSGLDIPGALFEKSEIKSSDFIGCKLSKANFNGVIFNDVHFHNSDLTKCDFRNAAGYMIDPRSNQLSKARFDLPEAISFLGFLGILLE